MIRRITILLTVVMTGFSLVEPGAAQDPPRKEGERPRTKRRAEARLSAKEKEFKEALEGSTLKGTWQMTGEEGLKGKAPLGESRPDTYTISQVSKGAEDYWVISARVQYADKDVTIPISVRVVWAGDTPIITLDKMALPGLGTYSARVMIYRGFYSGTWFGTNYGGVLSGQILKESVKGATSQPHKVDD